jgi:FtsZ-binding cell division protein ZapB
MQSYLSIYAPTPEPEVWDAAAVLELLNPLMGRWSCPSLTPRNRRCENVVDQERSIKATAMIQVLSLEDPGVIVKDEIKELTALAEMMLCPLHLASDGGGMHKKVVARWKILIKIWMRSRAQLQSGIHHPRAPSVGGYYQPTTAPASLAAQLPNTPQASERTTTVSDVQTRPRTVALDSSSTPLNPAPSRGATFDLEALGDMMHCFKNLSLEIQELKNENLSLRDDNARLVDKEKAAAAEHSRTEDALEVVDEERRVLLGHVDELYNEINSLRGREDRNLIMISQLEDALAKTNLSYRMLKKVWTADSVVSKGGK